ncbi:MAG: calcium-binding protein, partial [Cryobacterium sp.]|nr:calcium-binding protein [Cryobacterium sp.]
MRATDPAAPGTRARQSTLTPNAWVAIVFTASLIVGGLGFAGIPGLLLVLGTVGFATAAYSLVTGRRSWALFPSRTLAAFVLAGCLASTTVGATLRHPPEALTTTAGIAASAGTTNLTADEAPNDATALTLLATLLVKGKAPKTGYDRTGQFGTAWLDVDRNGCDTRNDILARDLPAIDRPGNCTVLTGTLQEPYTGRAIRFVRG